MTAPDLLGRDVSMCAGYPPRQQHTEPGHPEQPNLSDQARDLVNGARQEAYGEPQDNLSRIGVAWSSIFGCEPISAYKVALAMTALKLVRAAHRGDEDSIRDAFGYLHLAEEFRP